LDHFEDDTKWDKGLSTAKKAAQAHFGRKIKKNSQEFFAWPA
jgi:hypothetical protein